MYLFRGTRGVPSIIGVQLCSFTFWALFVIPVLIVLLLTIIQGRIIYYNYQKKLILNYPFCVSDITWTNNYLYLLPPLALLMGLLSTALGIGGGLILGPVLVSLISNPLISTASSNALVLITSSSSTIQFIIMGKLDYKYAIFCLIATISGSLMGSLMINWIVKKTGRASYVIIALAIVCALSAVTIPINTTYDMINRYKRGFSLMEGGSICTY